MCLHHVLVADTIFLYSKRLAFGSFLFIMQFMQVFIANIDSISKEPDTYLALLSPTDQERATKFHRQSRRLQFILGHLMTDNIGQAHTSIAHKDKWVVVAASSNGPVGIDIENTSINRDFMAAATVMGLNPPATLYDFYKDFTLAEATYKLGSEPTSTHFISHEDYLICVTATKQFALPQIHQFNVDSLLMTK